MPVERVGRLVLNRNPDNFFAETEQVAFHPGHVVPGIDFTNDPLLQGRLFSYTDTQLMRLGGPNFHEIPINRPIAPVHNNQRDGLMRQTINRGKINYEPNSIGGGCPMQAGAAAGGFVTFPERIDALKVRARSEKFFDHFSQATLFFNSQTPAEKDHIVEALRFELGKVERLPIRKRMVGLLGQVDAGLAARVAEGLGFAPPPPEYPINQSIPADGDVAAHQPRAFGRPDAKSPALSMVNTIHDAATRKVAILAADGVDGESVVGMRDALLAAGARGFVIAPRLGTLETEGGDVLAIDHSLLTASSVLFDAVYVPGGAASVATLLRDRDAVDWIAEAYRHCKAIAASSEGIQLLEETPGVLGQASSEKRRSKTNGGDREASADGIFVSAGSAGADFAKSFVAAVSHRFWNRVRKNRLGDAAGGDETRGRVPLPPAPPRPGRRV